MDAAREVSEFDDANNQRIEFTSHGASLIGNLFLYVSLSRTQRLPAIVVTGPWLTVHDVQVHSVALSLMRPS